MSTRAIEEALQSVTLLPCVKEMRDVSCSHCRAQEGLVELKAIRRAGLTAAGVLNAYFMEHPVPYEDYRKSYDALRAIGAKEGGK